MPTIYDVAREAGVSIGTVSYVINGTKRLRPETVRRVREAMRRLNYRPHAAAKALALGRTNVIALVHPIYIYDFQMILSTVTMAVGEVLAETDFRLNVLPVLKGKLARDELDASINARAMDGVILLHTMMHDERVELLRRAEIPFVAIGRCEDNEGLYLVDADVEAAATLAVEHLVSLGHRSIAYISHQEDRSNMTSVNYRLLAGFRDALQANGLPLDERLFLDVPASTRMDDAVQALLTSATRPTALLGSTEAAVMGALKAASGLGLRVPQDVAVIGYADSPLYPLVSPPCTAVFDQLAEMGRRAAQMLVMLLDGDEPAEPQVLLPPQLVARASTVG